MAVSETVLQLSRRHAGALLDRALAEALDTAEMADLPVLVDQLLLHGGPVGGEGLVRHFHLLPQRLQDRVVREAGRLDRALRNIGQGGTEQERLNALRIISLSTDRRLLDQISRHLQAPEARVTREAAAILLRWTQKICGSRGEAMQGRGDWQQALGRAVVDGCRSYARHRRRDVLLAACCLGASRPDWLERFFNTEHGAATRALGAMMDSLDQPPVCRLLLEMLGHPVLESMALRAIARPKARRWVGLWLEKPSLLDCPAVRKALAGLERANHLIPARQELAEMSTIAQRALVRWIDRLPLAREAKLLALGRLGGCPDRQARLLSVRMLESMRCEQADDLISCYCFDPSGAVARRALRWLIRRNWTGLTRLLTHLVDSRFPCVQKMAERHLAARSFTLLWSQWTTLDAATRRGAARAWLKLDRDDRQRLTGKLRDERAENRLRAVSMIRALGLADRFAAELIDRLEDVDGKVASSAAAALGSAGATEQMISALGKVLDHPDDRVRSNAIESLRRLGRLECSEPRLLRLAREGGNRSRATALWAMLQQPTEQSMAAMAAMLNDPRPAHRLSALWVVNRTRPLALIRRVTDLARRDPEIAVRRAARRITQGLLNELPTGRRALGAAG